MAKKPVSSPSSKKSPSKASSSKRVASTPVRNTPVPKTVSKPVSSTAVRNSPVPKSAAATAPRPAAAPAKREITQADIAKRAYEIWASGKGGSESDNWHRAERELRGL